MRIVFMGTPDFSVPVLDALIEAGHEIACVYCQPPRPAGRGKKDRPSPVQRRAEALGLPVRHPESLKSPEAQAEFAALGADVGVVVAYGLIRPQAEVGVTYAQKIDKAEAWIDWGADAAEVDRIVRGLSPFPGSWTMACGKRVKILGTRVVEGSGTPGTILDDATVACGTGAVTLNRVQPEGKSPMSAEEWLRGVRLPPGTRLGDAS